MAESEAFNERLVIELQRFWEHLKAASGVCCPGLLPAPRRNSSQQSWDAWRTVGSRRSPNAKKAFWRGPETLAGGAPSGRTLLQVQRDTKQEL